MKYNTSKIMASAWQIARETGMDFSEALSRAWTCAKINALRIELAKQASGVAEEVHTYAGWKDLGFEVEHGSKRLFQVRLIYANRDETYLGSFFGRSQVAAIA